MPHVGDIMWSVVDSAHELPAIVFVGQTHAPSFSGTASYQQWWVVRLTPKGWWVQDQPPAPHIMGCRVWVDEHSRRIAPTKERALELARRRRSTHVRMCEMRLAQARARLEALERLRELPCP